MATRSVDLDGRFVFLDGLRGIAAVVVALFHFYTPLVSPLHDHLSRVFPAAVQAVLAHGDLGVEVFFVLSGFVISHTLRGRLITPGYAVNFIVRRHVRLDPPFWTVLVVSVLWKCVLYPSYTPQVIRAWDGLTGLAANAFYLQDLLHYKRVVSVAWTLCLEVQFYLALIALVALSQVIDRTLRRRASKGAGPRFTSLFVLGPALGLYSLYVWFTEHTYGFFVLWHMFFAGVVLYWALSGRVADLWLGAYLLLIGTLSAANSDRRTAVVLGTVAIIYAAGRLGGLKRWSGGAVVQYFGRISYSLYLVHIGIGTAVIDVMRVYGDGSRFVSVAAYGLAFVASVLTADLLHRLVEAPSVELSKSLRPRALQGPAFDQREAPTGLQPA
jgi:peptidoglycan/LPS O-acetylase OafA/YrhL